MIIGVIGLSNETHFRLAKSNVVYRSITNHANQWFAPVGRYVQARVAQDGFAGRVALTASRSWHSPAFVDIFSTCSFMANAVEAGFRGDWMRMAISLIYVAGCIAIVHLIECTYRLDSHYQSPGLFAGIKAWYQKTVSAPLKAVFANTGFWFPLGNAATMLEQGIKSLLNPLGAIGFLIASWATLTAMKPLLHNLRPPFASKLRGQVSAKIEPASAVAFGRFRLALVSRYEASMRRLLGERAGRAQRIGAVGDFIAAINSLSLGHYEIGIALACWGVSNWLLGGLSNKAAFDTAASPTC